MTQEKLQQYTKEIPKDLNGKIEILLKERQDLALRCDECVNTSEIKSSISQIGLVNLKIKHLLGL